MAFGDMKTVVIQGKKVIADEGLFGLILDYSNDRDMAEDLANQLKIKKARNCSMIPADLEGKLQHGPIRGYGYGEYAGNTAAWKLAFDAVDSRRPNWKDAEDEEIEKWCDMHISIKRHLRASRLKDLLTSARKRGVTDEEVLEFIADHHVNNCMEAEVVRIQIKDLKDFLPEHLIDVHGTHKIVASPDFFRIWEDFMPAEKFDALKNYVSKQPLHEASDNDETIHYDETIHFELWPTQDSAYSIVASNCHGWTIALTLASEAHADKEKIQDLYDIQTMSTNETFDAIDCAYKKLKITD